jgi:energy-coupling factor transporter ATP-binding protein EcfA2
MSVVETERLTKRYGSQRGIDDVTVSVEAGEVFGLLGPNGAGKTTLIRTLLDLLHPTTGSARLFGLDSRRHSLAIRRRLGNLPGDFSYGPPSLTGREILALFARLTTMRTIRNLPFGVSGALACCIPGLRVGRERRTPTASRQARTYPLTFATSLGTSPSGALGDP